MPFADLDVVGVVPLEEAADACHEYPSPPAVHGAKVKTLLTGLGLSADELAQLRGDPAALKVLIDDWFDTPEAHEKLIEFFASADPFESRTSVIRSSCRA